MDAHQTTEDNIMPLEEKSADAFDPDDIEVLEEEYARSLVCQMKAIEAFLVDAAKEGDAPWARNVEMAQEGARFAIAKRRQAMPWSSTNRRVDLLTLQTAINNKPSMFFE